MPFQLYADAAFSIGQMHVDSRDPCQDDARALVSSDGRTGCVIVADGCSSVMGDDGQKIQCDTDVGAKVVTLTTRQAIREMTKTSAPMTEETMEKINTLQWGFMTQQRHSLGLKVEDLYATCLYAYITQAGGIINLRGDGVVAVLKNDGQLETFRCRWPDAMGPFYPVHQDNPAAFIAARGGDMDAEVFTVESVTIPPDRSTRTEQKDKFSLADGMQGVKLIFPLEMLENVSAIGLFSDGVERITKRVAQGELAPGELPPVRLWYEVVLHLMTYPKSRFISKHFGRNRLQRFLDQAGDAVADGVVYPGTSWGPDDDISMAVIRLQHEESST